MEEKGRTQKLSQRCRSETKRRDFLRKTVDFVEMPSSVKPVENFAERSESKELDCRKIGYSQLEEKVFNNPNLIGTTRDFEVFVAGNLQVFPQGVEVVLLSSETCGELCEKSSLG